MLNHKFKISIVLDTEFMLQFCKFKFQLEF